MACDDRGNQGTVFGLNTQALPALVLGGSGRGVVAAHHITGEVLVGAVHTGVDDGDGNALAGGFTPQVGKAVLGEPVLAGTDRVTLGGSDGGHRGQGAGAGAGTSRGARCSGSGREHAERQGGG